MVEPLAVLGVFIDVEDVEAWVVATVEVVTVDNVVEVIVVGTVSNNVKQKNYCLQQTYLNFFQK